MKSQKTRQTNHNCRCRRKQSSVPVRSYFPLVISAFLRNSSASAFLGNWASPSVLNDGRNVRADILPSPFSTSELFLKRQKQISGSGADSNSNSKSNLRKTKSRGFQKSGLLDGETSSNYIQGTMDSALCIIPPDDAWDNIQRARHFARDPSFYRWPPAIRLFHPFVARSELTEVATAIAEVIEKYELEAFEITFKSLLIVPHFEDLEEHEEALRELPKQAQMEEDKLTEDEARVQALILDEEAKGKKKLAKRKAKEQGQGMRKENPAPESDEAKNENSAPQKQKGSSPQQLLKEQRKSLGEFNGPCVLCLEPDEDSKIHIQAFREILRKKLFDQYDPFSPSSTVTDTSTLQRGLPERVLNQHGFQKIGSGKTSNKKSKQGVTFKPMISLGRFSTVSKAVDVARKLQQVWEPLTFQVNDLHLISTVEESLTISNDPFAENDQDLPGDPTMDDPYCFQTDEFGNPMMHENREHSLRKFHGSDGTDSVFSTKGEYGCDAMIMLSGEESQLLKKKVVFDEEEAATDEDDVDEDAKLEAESFYLEKEDEDRIMELLLSPAALPGGQVSKTSGRPKSYNRDDEEEDYLQHWLGEDDDDVDDGATIIIDRTQFFMGEMRHYTGMPASSTMDGKDRSLGKVSGSARRRGAVHRQGDRWREGDFGQKEKDYLP